MWHLLSLEEIESLLLQVPALVSRFDERDPEFIEAVNSWMINAEAVLTGNRMPVASEIAVCRGELISSQRGYPDGSPTPSKVGTRSQKEARAAHLLRRATDILSESIRSRRAQFDEASRLMMQIVAVADHLGLIPAGSGPNHTAYLQAILDAMSNRPELASLVVHVTGLLGKSDRFIVLDRAIAAVRH